MQQITMLTTCFLLAAGALAASSSEPGLPAEPPAAVEETITHPAVEHSLVAQGPGPTAVGPIEVNTREAALLEPALAQRRQLAGETEESFQGFVTEAAAAWRSGDADDASALEVRAPGMQPGEPLETKATGDILRNFDGLSGSATTSPDAMVAVGPDHVLQTVNSGFRAFHKTGLPAGPSTSFEAFFFSLLPPGWRGRLSGPQVVYSQEHGKYLLLISGVDEIARESYFFLAVSTGSDPRSPWWIYRINNQPPNSDSWLGDASLGVDTWGVYLTGNMYSWNDDTLQWSALFSFNTGPLIGGSANSWVFFDLRWPDASRAFDLRPAMPHTVSSEQTTFFVNTRPQAGDQIALWRLVGDRVNSPTLTNTAIATMPYQAIGEQVDQPGTDFDIDGGDARIGNAIYAFRRVYAAWTSDPGADGESSAIHWLKLSTDSNSLITEEILHGGNGWYYFYPAITINGGDGQLLDTGLFFNAVERDALYLSTAAYVYSTDGEETLRLIAQGDRPYFRPSGRYNGAAYDWSRPGWMWGTTPYAASVWWDSRIAAVAMDDEASNDDGGDGSECIPSTTTACVLDGRFKVEVVWRDFSNTTGDAQLVPFSSESSVLFWFFSADNWEMMVKVLDACSINNRFWVFAAATTDVAYTLRVTDTEDDTVTEYTNPLGNAAAAITDTDAFATCQ